MRKLFKNKEKKHLNIHIFEWDIDVYVPENEEQLYFKAAENVSKKIETYMDCKHSANPVLQMSQSIL